MFNQFSCLSVEDNLNAEELSVSEPASLVASTNGVEKTGINSDHTEQPAERNPALDVDGPPKPVNKPMVWIDLEMTGMFQRCDLAMPGCVHANMQLHGSTQFTELPHYRPGHR